MSEEIKPTEQAQPSAVETAISGGQQQAATSSGIVEGVATETKPEVQATGITPDQIEAILKRVVPQQTGQQAQSARQWTQDEFDEKFRVAKVTPQLMTALGLQATPEAMAGMQELMTNIVRQALTMGHYQQAAFKETLDGELSPIKSYYQKQQEAAAKTEFFDQYKDLKEYEPLIDSVVAQMKTEGKQYSREDAFKEVASRTKQILSRLPKGQPTQAPTAGSQSRMSTVTTGGQGAGGGGSAGKTIKGPPGIEVFR